jgi:hypothetical protein
LRLGIGALGLSPGIFAQVTHHLPAEARDTRDPATGRR